jgi:hypothetical protein
VQDGSLVAEDLPVKLGPLGPFPAVPLARSLERRWLHYAFLSRDNELGMVANISWLGPDAGQHDKEPRCMSILLLYHRGEGWRSSQFNAITSAPPWSAFRLPHDFNEPGRFELRSTSTTPFVTLTMQRSSRPCTSQCVPFAQDQHLRWQSETGVIARGDWGFGDRVHRDVVAIGYHERVRGYWGWPELGGWVFGFANDPQDKGNAPPPTAVVFTLIQTADHVSATGSVMVWREGQLRRHFPRRCVKVAARGYLDRDLVAQVPPLSNLLGVPPMSPVPRYLVITARLGDDWVVFDYRCEAAARVVVPSETGIHPFSVHEIVGPCRVEGEISGQAFMFETYGIVEFAGGAGGD